ncbi:MAG: DNA polymerase III subunit delta, partial [Cyanobacteria bacterium P01_D01_bin.123]
MPIYFYWGDDRFSLNRAVHALRERVLSEAWSAFNFDRLPASDTVTGLNQAMTPPLGEGDRLVWLEETTLVQQCSDDLFVELQRTLDALPASTHLLLTSGQKPDGRLKSTKLLKKVAQVETFAQLAPWDTDGLLKLVKAEADARQVQLTAAAGQLLAEAVGTDRQILAMELEKLSLFAGDKTDPISAEEVAALVPASAYNSFQLAAKLRQGQGSEALEILTHLLDRNEPALKILAVLVNQFRTWLWVKLMIEAGERDNKAIAKAADIGNPNRVYFLQKEVRSLSSSALYRVMALLAELDYDLKRGSNDRRSFQMTCAYIAEVMQGRSHLSSLTHSS